MPICDQCWEERETAAVGGVQLCVECAPPPETAVPAREMRLRALEFCIAAKKQVPWNEEDPASRLKEIAALERIREELLS